MSNVTTAILHRIVRTIVDEVDPEQVVLFGSRARGDARPDSDVDLLVVESEPFGAGRSRHSEMLRLDRALAATPVAKDVLVYSREEMERWRDSLNHVAARALREGRVLYDKAAPAPISRADRGVPRQEGRRSPYGRKTGSARQPPACWCVREGDDPGPDLDQARLLLAMADRDLQMLTLARDSADASDESSGFHVQQAAEKCLKAWIALLGEEYPLTHDIGVLIDCIRRQDEAVSEFGDLARFGPFAVQFRYEPLPEDAEPIDRPAASRQVESLRRAVERRFPPPESTRVRALTLRTTPPDTRGRGPTTGFGPRA